jgi:hypothetical protein
MEWIAFSEANRIGTSPSQKRKVHREKLEIIYAEMMGAIAEILAEHTSLTPSKQVLRLKEGKILVRRPFRSLETFHHLQMNVGAAELMLEAVPVKGKSEPMLLVSVGTEMHGVRRLLFPGGGSLHTHGHNVPVKPSSTDTVSSNRDWKISGIKNFVVAFEEGTGEVHLAVFAPQQKNWEIVTDQKEVLRRLKEAHFLAAGTEEKLRKAEETWRDVVTTPAYEGVRRGVLPVFYAQETWGAIPLAAKAGPILILAASSAERAAVVDLMIRLSIPASYYEIRMISGKEQVPAVLAQARRELSKRFEVYPVNPEQPGWLEELLSVLEEQGQLPVGDLGPAIEAAQDYFQFV